MAPRVRLAYRLPIYVVARPGPPRMGPATKSASSRSMPTRRPAPCSCGVDVGDVEKVLVGAAGRCRWFFAAFGARPVQPAKRICCVRFRCRSAPAICATTPFACSVKRTSSLGAPSYRRRQRFSASCGIEKLFMLGVPAEDVQERGVTRPLPMSFRNARLPPRGWCSECPSRPRRRRGQAAGYSLRQAEGARQASVSRLRGLVLDHFCTLTAW